MSTLAIKAESELEDETENVPFEETKPKSKLFLQLENRETIENVDLDQYYCRPTFSRPDYKSPTYFATQNDAQLKNETRNDIEKTGGIIYDDWKIKREEVDIKEEDLEQKESRNKNISCDEIDELVRVKNEEAIDASDYIPAIENWTVKQEELVLKEEDLEVGETGISSNVYQNRQDTPKHIPEKNHQYETQASSTGSSERDLHRHINPEEDKEFKCSNCDYQTHWKGALKRHLLRYNPEKVQKFKCSRCPFLTNHKNSLKRHLLLHISPEKVKKFKCKQCEYKTLDKDHLNRHLVRHKNPEEVDKFKCSQCDFEALQKRTLKRHLLSHMNPEEVDKFKCTHCEFETLNKDYLKLHLLKHGNPETVNKFKCGQCKYETHRKYHLKRHLLMHMNQEEVHKFKCSRCEFETLHKGNLKLHLLRHVNPNEVNK